MRSIIIVSIVLMIASCAHMQTGTPWPTETPTPEDTALETSTPSPTGTQSTGTPTSCPLLEFSSKQHEIVPWIPLEQQMQDFIDWLWINDRSFTECNQDHPELYTDALILKQAASISTPGPGYYSIYGKVTDGSLRAVNDAGTEYIIGITSSSTTNTPTVTQTPTRTPTPHPWVGGLIDDADGQFAKFAIQDDWLDVYAMDGLETIIAASAGVGSVSMTIRLHTEGRDGLYTWIEGDPSLGTAVLCVGLVPTITPTPTSTNTPTSTETPSPSPTVTDTPEPTATNTSAPTATPTTGFCSVVVSGAGSTQCNGTYDYTGMSDGCGYYEQRVDPNYVITIDTTVIDPPNPYWVITDYGLWYYKSSTTPCDYNWSSIEWQTFDGSDDPPTTACE